MGGASTDDAAKRYDGIVAGCKFLNNNGKFECSDDTVVGDGCPQCVARVDGAGVQEVANLTVPDRGDDGDAQTGSVDLVDGGQSVCAHWCSSSYAATCGRSCPMRSRLVLR